MSQVQNIKVGTGMCEILQSCGSRHRFYRSVSDFCSCCMWTCLRCFILAPV